VQKEWVNPQWGGALLIDLHGNFRSNQSGPMLSKTPLTMASAIARTITIIQALRLELCVMTTSLRICHVSKRRTSNNMV
jgi:hypothetical protein